MQPITLTAPLPSIPGTYILVLRVETPCIVAVGKLGTAALTPGWLLYVGSAFGPGGLAGRLHHHLRPAASAAKPHWHIDYLRAALPLVEVWLCPAPERLEHRLALALHAAPGSSIPLPRCGASDCTCPAHLFAFADRPTPHLLTAASLADVEVFTLPATTQG